MARIQILELPEGTNDDRPPFALVIDQYEPTEVSRGITQEPTFLRYQSMADQIGARAVLVFEDTIDIPANEVLVDPDGYPLKLRVEGDFGEFRAQVHEEMQRARQALLLNLKK